MFTTVATIAVRLNTWENHGAEIEQKRMEEEGDASDRPRKRGEPAPESGDEYPGILINAVGYYSQRVAPRWFMPHVQSLIDAKPRPSNADRPIVAKHRSAATMRD